MHVSNASLTWDNSGEIGIMNKSERQIIQILIKINYKLECGPMPNVMVVLPNIGGALCSTLQSAKFG